MKSGITFSTQIFFLNNVKSPRDLGKKENQLKDAFGGRVGKLS